MENPILLYTSHQRFEVEVFKAKLEEHGIGAFIIDKQDSAYVVIGEAELHVEAEHLERAREILGIK